MSLTNNDKVHSLLSKYSFIIDNDSEIRDLFCLICTKLMTDACQTACGCQYCHGCISSYLSKENLYCPGGKTECNEDFLSLERDVFRNVRLTSRILKVIVKCPNALCNSKMELIQMDEHLKICSLQSSPCIYASIGCNEDFVEHVKDDTMSHSRLVILSIINLKNELDAMMEAFNIIKTEMDLIRGALNEKEIEFVAGRRTMEILKGDAENKDNVIAIMDHDLMEMRYEVEQLTSRLKEEVNEREVGIVCEIVIIVWQTQMESQRLELEILKVEVSRMEWEKSRIEIEDLKKEINGLRVEIGKYNDDRERRMNNLIRVNKLCPNIDMDFVWKIEEYSRKRRTGTDIYSDPFVSHNYRLCLNLYIYGDNVGLWCVLMAGDNDDSLQWPMSRAVTLSIIDQETKKAHKSSTFQHDSYQRNKRAFDRPKMERNEYRIGTDSFLRHCSIKDTTSILVGDAIVVSCFLR